VSPFSVAAASREDVPRVRELAQLSGSGFDPEAELARSWALLWVARAEGANEVIGFALAWRAADERHLLDLAVDPGWRRKGVGRHLLAAVLEEAHAGAARLVVLEARASNAAALGLYRSAGFLVTDVRRAYYSDNGEDAVVMRLELLSPLTEREL
jgi:ribosomal-protein-alanine N-acetyltransferase